MLYFLYGRLWFNIWVWFCSLNFKGEFQWISFHIPKTAEKQTLSINNFHNTTFFSRHNFVWTWRQTVTFSIFAIGSFFELFLNAKFWYNISYWSKSEVFVRQVSPCPRNVRYMSTKYPGKNMSYHGFSKSVDIWRTGADTCFTFGPNSKKSLIKLLSFSKN